MNTLFGQRAFNFCCLSAALLVIVGCTSSTSRDDAATKAGFDSLQSSPEAHGGNLGSGGETATASLSTAGGAPGSGGNNGSAGGPAAAGISGTAGTTAPGGSVGSSGSIAPGGKTGSAGALATGGTVRSGGTAAAAGALASTGTGASNHDAGAGGATSSGGSPDAVNTSSDGASCSGWTTLVHLSPQQLKDLLAAQDVFLINVRSPTAPDIAGTDLSLQAGTDVTPTVTAIEELVKHDLCADIVIYCVSGNTSQRVATPLISKGYLRVRDLQGGITNWQSLGFPVVQPGSDAK